MGEMSDVELLIILGFYYIGKEKNVEKFTILFNSYFGRELSSQIILHEVYKFRNVNPFNNVSSSKENVRYQKLWQEYIEKGKIDELKSLYKCFKDGEFVSYFEGNKISDIVTDIDVLGRVSIVDEPKEIKGVVGGDLSAYKRDKLVVDNALYAAGYKCEGNCGTELFMRKDGKTYYTEGHHLIPLKFQPNFEYSLDVEANVVSLCPMCHGLIHYGLENAELLKILHNKRAERLKKCSIYISYEKLLLLYAGNIKDGDM